MKTMVTVRRWAMAAVLVAAAAGTAPSAVEACGGCFAPPNAVQVVTDHRMVLSLSSERTILWDQFRYTGRPADFSWILPIRNGPSVRIEVADNRFMQALDNLTAPALNPPPRPTRNCRNAEFDSNSARGGAAGAPPQAAADSGVTVLQESVVGPYMTVVVRGEDAMSLRNWLRDNGYAVPAAIEPVIEHYVGLRMDFLALKLRPGEGIDRMTPVRVITPGMNPSLPLRMIAAGTADKVGLQLTVIALGRYEAMNFPNGEITPEMLTYDFNAPTSPTQDFTRAFDALNRASGNRLWLTESVQRLDRSTVERAQQSVRTTTGGPVGGPMVVGDDATVAFQGIGQQAMISRLRADMAQSVLDRDLQLAASARAERNRFYTYGRVLNTPAPPWCPGDPVSSSAECSARPGHTGGSMGGLTVLVGLAGVAVLARRRKA